MTETSQPSAARASRYAHPDYRSTSLRAPSEPLWPIPQAVRAAVAPVATGSRNVRPQDADLTIDEPLGERIVVAGRLHDDTGSPVRNSLVEIWQANAAGRYHHEKDDHRAPLDPGFVGTGRCVTDDDGWYRFLTIRPGAYPWLNHPNAWRPSHIHFSLFGPGFGSRLVTQMYFPGDPLLPLDPVFHAVRDEQARGRLIASFDLDLTEPEWALGYRFDIVLAGHDETPVEHEDPGN